MMFALPPFVVPFAIGLAALSFLIGISLAQTPMTPGRRWVLLFGIIVLPGLALLVGTNQSLEAMESPAFCGSCHIMQPWLRDLHDPKSTNLAAVHYQNRFILENQCYTCHTDYAIFGPVEAKMEGLVHFWRYVTGTYKTPIALYQPYRFSNCLHCHGESKRYLEAHSDAAEAIADGSMTCLDCHAPVHPAQEGK